MLKSNFVKWICFTSGTLVGITSLSLSMGAVQSGNVFKSRITNDSALYQELSEIRVKKEAKIDFDRDISYLSLREKKFQEKLPRLTRSQSERLVRPIQRIEARKYVPAQAPARPIAQKAIKVVPGKRVARR